MPQPKPKKPKTQELLKYQWTDNVYGMTWIFLVGSYPDFAKHVNANYGQDKHPEADHFEGGEYNWTIACDKGNTMAFHLVWLKTLDISSPQSIATLAHEILHGCDAGFSIMGIQRPEPLTAGSDEAKAYYLYAVIFEVLRALKSGKFKPNSAESGWR